MILIFFHETDFLMKNHISTFEMKVKPPYDAINEIQ